MGAEVETQIRNAVESIFSVSVVGVRTDLRAVLANAAESVETSFGGRQLAITGNGGSPVLAAGNLIFAWFVSFFDDGHVLHNGKGGLYHVRAVRNAP